MKFALAALFILTSTSAFAVTQCSGEGYTVKFKDETATVYKGLQKVATLKEDPRDPEGGFPTYGEGQNNPYSVTDERSNSSPQLILTVPDGTTVGHTLANCK